MTLWLRIALCFGLALVGTGCATRSTDSRHFSFALVGDQQYDEREEALFPAMLASMNNADIAFVVHVGDFKAGSNSPCTDTLYERRRAEFDQSRHALVFTPGDNDWVDCRRPTNGRADPLERLAKIRELFFATPFSLGKQPIPLSRQSIVSRGDPVLSKFSENAMWTHGGIVFATVNVQGSNDNLGFDAANDKEHAERTQANTAWLKRAAIEAAKGSNLGLAIFLQANPGFEAAATAVARSGYVEFLRAFEQEARVLDKPVLFAHGDTHHFRVDRPYLSPLDKRPLANVLRVETFGSPLTDWVRITVDPRNARHLFSVSPGGFVAPIATE